MSIIIIVDQRRPKSVSLAGRNVALVTNIGKGPISIVMEEVVGDRFEFGGMTIGPPAGQIDTAYFGADGKVPLEVTRHKEIQVAVVVVIDKARTHVPAVGSDAASSRHVGECPVTVIVIEDALPKVGDKQVGETVVIVISDGHTHAVTLPFHAGLFCYVCECPIVVVAK